MKKISVIIPMYKVEKYLEECLNSIVNQKLEDIEIICVDDGSPDRSGDIALEWSEKYKNIKVIRKDNGGLSSARNTGIEHATGKYMYFIDSDDYLDSNALEELYLKAESEQLDILYFNTTPFFETEEVKNENKSYVNFYKRTGDYSGVYTGQEMFARMRENREFFGSACLQLIRKSLLEENQIRFYDGILHEDNLFSFQCVMLAKRVGYIDKAFYHRRVRDDSIMTSKKTMKNVEGLLVCYKEIIFFLEQCQIQENVSSHILDYLYNSIYRSGFNVFHSLDEQENDLLKDDICALHFLDRIQKEGKIENERKIYKAEKEDLQKKLRLSNENIDIKNKENRGLKEELDIKNSETRWLKKEIEIQKKKNTDLVSENVILNRKLKSFEKRCNGLETSWDYKIGKMVMFVPRKVKKGIVNIKNRIAIILQRSVKKRKNGG